MSDKIFQMVLVYLDEILMYSSYLSEHLDRLDTVLQRLKDNGLKVKVEKCHFLQSVFQFLGHQVSAQGLSADPEKIGAVRQWPVPGSLRELRSFLGFCSYYRKFIDGFSQVAGPLHDVVISCLQESSQSKVQWLHSWNSECQLTFENLKDKLTSSPVLGYVNFTLPFLLETNASNLELGAVLYQYKRGTKTVISYASRRLRGSKRNDRNYSSMK